MKSRVSREASPRQSTKTVAEILADPALMAEHTAPLFAVRGALDVRYRAVNPVLVEITEAEALLDLQRFVQEAGPAMEARRGHRKIGPYTHTVDEFVSKLRIVGRQQLEVGADVIAESWEQAIRKSRRGEILVGVEAEDSTLLIHQMIMRALARRNPDAARAVVPFDLGAMAGESSRRSRDRLRYGAELADDCVITGRQLRRWSRDLIRQGAKPEDIHSMFVSAPPERIASATDAGVPKPIGVFTHPNFEQGEPGITTTVSASDFGFRHILSTALSDAGVTVHEENPSIQPPLLMTPVSEYRLPKNLGEAPLPTELQERVEALDAICQQPWINFSSR